MDICGEMYVLISVRDVVFFGYEGDVILPWEIVSGWAFREWLILKSPS